MCSVVGYIGHSKSKQHILEGLSRLEYRGYDSAGFACFSCDVMQLQSVKVAGRLKNLRVNLQKDPIDGYVGIGHTRWSTHGQSTNVNAHPHFDCQKNIALVHNGIVENAHTLRTKLVDSGHVFVSETDTEVVAHFFEALRITHKTFKAAVVDWVTHLEGAYAFLMLMQDKQDTVLLVRKRSPLCIGIGDDEMFLASDTIAFAGKTNKVLFLPDESFAFVSKDMIELYDFQGNALPLEPIIIENKWDESEKKGHEHFMLKEIYEQKTAIHATVDFLSSISDTIWDYIGIDAMRAQNLDKLYIIGCGTSWHAARIAQFFFESIALIPARTLLASEFRYMPFFPSPDSLYIAISQSGETADTLEALRLVNTVNRATVALTNTPSSTMVREAGGFFLTQAGPEIAVASTKAFSTQLAALYWFAHRLAYEKGIILESGLKTAEKDLLIAAEVLENTIENYKFDIISRLAKKYAQYDKAIFLGRHISYPFALEAALKLKEISYIFSQCYPAGELKHGPLALVDEHVPVFICSHQDSLIYTKLLANVQEVKARNGKVFAFAFEGQDELCELADDAIIIPRVKPLLGPLAMTGVMQFLFYAIAKELGRDIDKPRNLAKSVTVE